MRKGDARIVAGGRSRDKVLAVEGVVGRDAGVEEREGFVRGMEERLRGECRG